VTGPPAERYEAREARVEELAEEMMRAEGFGDLYRDHPDHRCFQARHDLFLR